ncbi:MAG: hypothetical protein AB7E60_03215 [Sphingobium sp.]
MRAFTIAGLLLGGCTAGVPGQAQPASFPPQPTHQLRVPFTQIETQCSGGVAGRFVRYQLLPDGDILKAEGFRSVLSPSGSMTADEARDLSERLDAIGFDSLKMSAPKRPVADGVICSIARTRSGIRRVMTTYHPGTPPTIILSELRAIRQAIENAARRAP